MHAAGRTTCGGVISCVDNALLRFSDGNPNVGNDVRFELSAAVGFLDTQNLGCARLRPETPLPLRGEAG